MMLLSIAPFDFMVWISIASFWILLQMGFLNYLNEFLKAVESCVQEALLICQGAAPSALLQGRLRFLESLKSVDLQQFYYIIPFAFYSEDCHDAYSLTAPQNHISNSQGS